MTGILEYGADQRHAELIVRELNLDVAMAVATPIIKKYSEQVSNDLQSPKLNDVDTKGYRSFVMRASYLSQDQSDIPETVSV